MYKPKVQPTGNERRFGDDEIIVSKTDKTGKILYANEVFLKVSGFTEAELLGTPHAVIRHPDMPRCVFKFLWDRLNAGEEVFAYVNNLAKNGDNYWVLAHVTPSRDSRGTILGFHSSRRSPGQGAVAQVVPLYKALRDIERQGNDSQEGMLKAEAHLMAQLAAAGKSYDEFIFSIISAHQK